MFSSLFTPAVTFAETGLDSETNLEESNNESTNEIEINDSEEDDNKEVIHTGEDESTEKDQADEQDQDIDKGQTEEDQEPATDSEGQTEEQEEKHDDKETKQMKERAPPVTVDVRVETHERTLVPKTEFSVESFELMEYINQNNNNQSVFPDTPRAIHALIQALETTNEFDLKDDDDFSLGHGGNYIESIGKDAEFTSGPMSGWMYFIDNAYVPVGVLARELQGGESIVLYYTQNFTDNTFSWFDQENYTVETGESLEVELTGVNYDVVNPVDGASILIDEEAYQVDGETVLTDEDGKINLVFDEPGTYHLSANRVNEAGERNIVRPYAIVEVTGEAKETDNDIDEENSEDNTEDDEVETDTTPPTISVEGITDGDIVTESHLGFTVDAIDDIDGEVEPIVEVNEETINGNGNEYETELVEGTNNIVITASDEAENQASETFEIIYELEADESYEIDERIEKTSEYMLSKGVNSEWEAIGLAKAGISVPDTYRDVFYQNVETQVDNALEFNRAKITDIERLVIAAVAIGEDPRDINGTDLIALLYDSPMRGITDTMILQGNNGPIFALIALDSKNFPEPFDSKWNREKLIKELLNNQHDDGSWSLSTSFQSPSIDITAMAITGLAPYKDQPEVDEAIQGALHYLSSVQNDQGGFTESFVGGTSSEATSQAIIALTAYGMDPTDEMFTKDGNNLVDHLLTYHNEDGGFSHLLEYPSSNGMATEQALQALVAYDLFLKDEGSLYVFPDKNDEDMQVEDVEALIAELPGVGDLTLKHKDAVQTAREAYEQLTAEQQAVVENIDKLEALEQRITELEEDASQVDKTALQEKIKEAETIDVSNKTDSSVSALNNIINEAKSILEKNDATQAEVNKAIKNITDAINNLEDIPVQEVDTSKLIEKVTEASNLDVTGKTGTSVEALKSALSNANWIIATPGITQTDVDQALQQLEEAIANLEDIIVEVEPRKETPVQAGETVKIKDKEDYVSIKLPTDLPANTKIIIDTIEEVESKDMSIAGAIVDVQFIFADGATFTGDYVLTLAVLDELNEESPGIYYFNEENDAWEYVGGEMDEDNKTISTVVNHFSTYGVFLMDDENNDKPDEEINKEGLEKALKQAQSLNKEGKTGSSLQALIEAITSGEAVLANEEATQSEVDAAIAAIDKAIANLEEIEVPEQKTDKSKLVDKIVDAKKIEKGNYTKQSLATLAEAISQAESVLNNEAATEAEITEAIKLIDVALKDLVEKTPSKEENPNQSSNNDVLGNGTNDNEKNGQNDKLHSNDNNNGLNSSPVAVGSGDTLELDQNKNEDNLPKTATSNYTLIFAGVLLLLVAGALLMIERRKTRN